MSESKHTPGPWRLGEEDNRNCMIPVLCGDEEEPYAVAEVSHYDDFPPGEQGSENAKLIAAAPELLEALEALVDDLDNKALRRYLNRNVVTTARKAIAKAKGED